LLFRFDLLAALIKLGGPMKPKSQWDGAHVRLKRLYDAKVPPGLTQREFGKKYAIGSQSMVAQYLNGDRPLNFDAAVKFAEALGVTVYDISPEMGDYIREKLIPVLGKALRRAAVVLLAVFVGMFHPSDATAGVLHNNSVAFPFAQVVDLICIVCRWFRGLGFTYRNKLGFSD
jgi:transcriptional regulator with XRE-family HTH domain